MQSFPAGFRALVLGASGAIGGALARRLEADPRCAGVTRLGRGSVPAVDFGVEASIAAAAAALKDRGPFHLIVNAAGLPALALPAGLGATGMPLGIQLVGRHGADGWLCAIGKQLEKSCPFAPLWERQTMHDAGACGTGMQSAREEA